MARLAGIRATPAGGSCSKYLEGVRSLELRRDRLDTPPSQSASEPDLAPTVSALRYCAASPPSPRSHDKPVRNRRLLPLPGRPVVHVPTWGSCHPNRPSGETVSARQDAPAPATARATLLVEIGVAPRPQVRPDVARPSPASGVPAAVARAAARANAAYTKRCARLRGQGKPANVVNAAVARRLPPRFRLVAREPRGLEAPPPRRACFTMARGVTRRFLCAALGPTRVLDAELPAEASECAATRGYQTRSRPSRTRHAEGGCGAQVAIALRGGGANRAGTLCPLDKLSTYQKSETWTNSRVSSTTLPVRGLRPYRCVVIQGSGWQAVPQWQQFSNHFAWFSRY